MPEKPGAYPPVFAHVIRNIVYDRLAPGVRNQLQELKKKRAERCINGYLEMQDTMI